MRSHFLSAEWSNLIMANYVVPRELLSPYLPNKTELDYFEGNTFVSLVGFMFLNTSILGLRIPQHVNFEEVNLRFYVRYNDKGNWKRGTVFIKEIVPKFAISFFANFLYGEKYSTMKMRHSNISIEGGRETSYEWKYQNKWNKISAQSGLTALPMRPGSEEEFIAEHYWGYTKYNEMVTYEYQVDHPRWEVFNVLGHKIDCDFSGLYGLGFSFLSDKEPSSIFMAKGSEIKIHHKINL